MSLPDLGLSPADRIMLVKNVNIVFHVAAAVRFNNPLNVAVNTNTKGTARIMELCMELNHSINVVYISIAIPIYLRSRKKFTRKNIQTIIQFIH